MNNPRPANLCDPSSNKAMQVLAAAKRLFIEQGFGATSMDAIAAGAGVSKATVYAHYPSKEALFAATTQRECHRMMNRMAISEEIGHLPLADALLRMATTYLEVITSGEAIALLRMVIAEVTRFPELGEIFYECAPAVTLNGMITFMRRQRDHGQLVADDCELAAAQFLGMLRGDLHLRLLLGRPFELGALDHMADEAVQVFMARYAPCLIDPHR